MATTRHVAVRRARVGDAPAILDVLSSAYEIEVGDSGVAFRSEGCYKNTEEIKNDIQLGRFEEKLCGFFVACANSNDLVKEQEASTATIVTSAHNSCSASSLGSIAGSSAAGSSSKGQCSSSNATNGGTTNATNGGGGTTNGGTSGGGVMKSLLDKVHGKLTGQIARNVSTNSLQSSHSGSHGSNTPSSRRDVIIGCIRVGMHKFASEKTVTYHDFAVVPTYQGLGVGRLLLKAAYEWALKRGVKKIVIQVIQHRSDLFVQRPTNKDGYLGITDSRDLSQLPSQSLFAHKGEEEIRIPEKKKSGSNLLPEIKKSNLCGLGGDNNSPSNKETKSKEVKPDSSSTQKNNEASNNSSPKNGSTNNLLEVGGVGGKNGCSKNGGGVLDSSIVVLNKSNLKKAIESLKAYPTHREDLLKVFCPHSLAPQGCVDLPQKTLLESLWPDKKSVLKGIPYYEDGPPLVGNDHDLMTSKKNMKSRVVKMDPLKLYNMTPLEIYTTTPSEIIEDAILHPDFKRPVAGAGYFGKLGYVQIGSSLADIQNTTRTPHVFLLMKVLA